MAPRTPSASQDFMADLLCEQIVRETAAATEAAAVEPVRLKSVQVVPRSVPEAVVAAAWEARKVVLAREELDALIG